MENTINLTDSLTTIHQIIELKNPEQSENIYQLIYYGAMITIALVNICLVLYIFFHNKMKDTNKEESNRKINLLKTLILDYKMEVFYLFFKQLKENSQKLQQKNLTDNDKKIIIDKIKDLGIEYRQDFIDIFIAIDINLYKKILSETDKLIDNLTDTIFDGGINLSHQPKYEEVILKPITESRTEKLKILFSYSG